MAADALYDMKNAPAGNATATLHDRPGKGPKTSKKNQKIERPKAIDIAPYLIIYLNADGTADADTGHKSNWEHVDRSVQERATHLEKQLEMIRKWQQLPKVDRETPHVGLRVYK